MKNEYDPQPKNRPFILDAVACIWFCTQMIRKLYRNRSKPHWKHMSNLYLLRRIDDEYVELAQAMTAKDGEIFECCDIALFAMMIADNVNRKRGSREAI